MSSNVSRRVFLANVGRGTLLASLGPAMAVELGFVTKAFAEQLDSPLQFGDLEPLVCELQQTPVSKLHAEKYFQTVRSDFHATRPSLRWQHVAGLARVTASEYGRPAAGQAEARELLRLRS